MESDPQANPVKCLAYDISKFVETKELTFRDIEQIVKSISDHWAIKRAGRLRQRSGLNELTGLMSSLKTLAHGKTKLGFNSFKHWAETAGQGIVLTAHPTFSLSRDIRNTLGKIATAETSEIAALSKHLKTLAYLPKRAPTLQEEHTDTQNALGRIQNAISEVNELILTEAKKAFPNRWTEITPCLVKVYSWVGYDIDGRTDISWGDAIRLRLLEKSTQVKQYTNISKSLWETGNFKGDAKESISRLVEIFDDALASSQHDLELFGKDLTNTDNLVAAANILTRKSSRRLRNTKALYPLISKALSGAQNDATRLKILQLRALIRAFGLGTARIHFRLNSRHVIDGVKAAFGIKERGGDHRTLLLRASKLTKDVKPRPVNFADLELETSTVHSQMILTAQIHKYIDDETPIRLLIAECEDSLTPLGMLYLAKLYGLDNHLDISPLFETANALNNGGRIIGKMLSNPVYKSYLKKRKIFAIQTGFSDAGRFMGQIPATLAIERLQSHFAREMAKHKMTDVTALIFNTHGESMGRGGHPGNLGQRMDYVMSPWAMYQFEKRGLSLCHETSFQGGDGFLWFQSQDLAQASICSLLLSRYEQKNQAEQDSFYTERDFSWDIFRTLSTEQESLYNDPNYVNVLGGFGQNLLVPTGSRAAKRIKGDMKTTTFNPRQLRAIPHNAILQQFGIPANVYYGIGKAAAIDPEKLALLLKSSRRVQSLYGLATTALRRSDISILTSYGRLFDPGFWIGRALSGNEPQLSKQSLIIADTLKNFGWRSKIVDLANRLRMDRFQSLDSFPNVDIHADKDLRADAQTLKILHALRLAILMKASILATELPIYSEAGASRLDVLQKLQSFQIDSVISDLKTRYPAKAENLDWTKKLQEKTNAMPKNTSVFPHLVETITKPLERTAQISRQITIAITHYYDAFG